MNRMSNWSMHMIINWRSQDGSIKASIPSNAMKVERYDHKLEQKQLNDLDFIKYNQAMKKVSN